MQFAIAIALLFVGLLLFIAGDRYVTNRTRKRIDSALAEDDDEVTAQIPITVVEAEPPVQAAAYDVRCEGVKRPWFSMRGRILDDDSIVIRDWGRN